MPDQPLSIDSIKAHALRLGLAIRTVRLARNLTQADLADESTVSLATLNRIERGDIAVGFTGWLQVLQATDLLPAVQAATEELAQRLQGEAARNPVATRQRATGSRRRSA